MPSQFSDFAMIRQQTRVQLGRKLGGNDMFQDLGNLMQKAVQPTTQSQAISQDGTAMPSPSRKKLSALVISGRKTQTLGGRRQAGDGTFVSAMLGGLV